jgi:hypothetical protein
MLYINLSIDIALLALLALIETGIALLILIVNICIRTIICYYKSLFTLNVFISTSFTSIKEDKT